MRIGIIGAGLCGLATAAFLARDGHAVEILERAPHPRPLGAGLLLQPPGTDILARLNTVPEGARITRLDSRATSGAPLIQLDYADLAPGLHGTGLTRPAIWSTLLDAATSAGARLLPACPIASVTEDATAILPSGEQRPYDLLVIAAGTHTPFWSGRPSHAARPYPWGCLWATVTLPRDWPRDMLMQRCRGTATMLGVLPTGGDTAALYWSIRNDRVPAWRAAPIAAWRDDIARTWQEAESLTANLTHADLEHATYRDVRAHPPFAGRLVVIGDAAHGTSPQLGQGTTQALRDALALAEALAADAPLEVRLAAYWSARRRRVGYYRLASRALTPVFQSGIPGLGPLRDLLAGPVGRLPFVRRQALLTLAGMKDGLFGADALPAPPR